MANSVTVVPYALRVKLRGSEDWLRTDDLWETVWIDEDCKTLLVKFGSAVERRVRR